MSGYFTFGWEQPARTDNRFWFLFKNSGLVDAEELADNIEQGVQRIPYPDVIGIICHLDDREKMFRTLRSDQSCARAVSRLSTRTRLLLLSYDFAGVLKKVESIHKAGAASDLQEKGSLIKQFEMIRRAGLAELFYRKEILIKAPGSFRFRKPSSGFASHFIRAEEVLDRSENVEFLAFCVSSRVTQSSGWKTATLDTIFIDSMAISSVAFALRERLGAKLGKSLRIESFHSHDGLKTLRAPVTGHGFCIISASSSMSLEREWLNKTRCDPADVVTLLTFGNADGAERALFSLDRPNDWSVQSPETEGLRTLQIIGERFQPEQLPARVTSLIRTHKCSKAAELAKTFSQTQLFDIWRHDGESIDRAFFANANVLRASEVFRKWLEKSLLEQVPAISAIVFQEDEASRLMAEDCSKFLNSTRGTSIGLIQENAADKHNWDESPVLVVAATISRGSRLSTIAQSLRPCKGRKIFIIGLQLARTLKDVFMLRTALETQHDGKNLVLTFQSVCIGDALKTSLEREKKLLLRFGEGLPDRLKARRDWLGRIARIPVEHVLLSNSDDTPLELRDDFQFWDAKSYTAGTTHAPMVLLTVAAALQISRSDEKGDKLKTLFSDALEQVVLGPATFERYNDGVVQAAILRNAYDAELDYSTLPESADMAQHISEMIRVRGRPQGEGLAEFLLALAIRRMRLRKNDLVTLREKWMTILSEGSDDDKFFALLLNEACS